MKITFFRVCCTMIFESNFWIRWRPGTSCSILFFPIPPLLTFAYIKHLLPDISHLNGKKTYFSPNDIDNSIKFTPARSRKIHSMLGFPKNPVNVRLFKHPNINRPHFLQTLTALAFVKSGFSAFFSIIYPVGTGFKRLILSRIS